jgi:hypothetical protein
MRSLHTPSRLSVIFDDDHAVANAGLSLAGLLSEFLGSGSQAFAGAPVRSFNRVRGYWNFGGAQEGRQLVRQIIRLSLRCVPFSTARLMTSSTSMGSAPIVQYLIRSTTK